MPVIEDVAQAIGAEFDGRRAGSMGDVGCLSFYPTRTSAVPEMAGCSPPIGMTWRRHYELLRMHGMQPRYYHRVVGINSRLDSFQAAVLNVKFPYLDQWTTQRELNARRYTEMFTAAKLDRLLGLPKVASWRRPVWNQYVVRVPDGHRDDLRAFLARSKDWNRNLLSPWAPCPECFRYLGTPIGPLPETEIAAKEVLALPIFSRINCNGTEGCRISDRRLL